MRDQPSGLPIAWTTASAEIVDRLDDPSLPQCLAEALGTLVSFDHCEQIMYRGTSNPLIMYDEGLSASHRIGLQNYVRYSYALNPFFRMYRAGLPTGAYRLRDLAEQRPSIAADWSTFRATQMVGEEIGYVTHGMPVGEEEVCIGLDMRGGYFAGVTLSRMKSRNGYSNQELHLLRSVVSFISAAYRRFWRQAQFTQSSMPQVAASKSLRTTPMGRLSAREREICQLLLRGHSTLSISLRLDISVTTVKTHRKNLYAKLNIATQFELFKLFADSLGLDRAAD